MFGPIPGNVWELSQDPQGCRRVQDALDVAPTLEAREALAEELRGNVSKALRCPHANHVLQKCITVMPPKSLQFIIDGLLARHGLVVQAAKHRYGCRIIQHLLRKCPAQQMQDIVEALLLQAGDLSCHVFGRYVMQQLVAFCTEEQCLVLVRVIEKRMSNIARSISGGSVIAAAIQQAAPEDKRLIARAALRDPEALRNLANVRCGTDAALLIVQTLDGRERARAISTLLEHKEELENSRFGWIVLEGLVEMGVVAAFKAAAEGETV